MGVSSALIFGRNEYGLEIAKNVTHKYKSVVVFALEEAVETKDDLVTYEQFDLSDDWDSLQSEHNMDESIVFCALNDEAKNIFLTISLRSAFPKVTIIALAKNHEDANKLKIAGASKVIPIVETTANIITDMIKKPIISEVLHDILYEEGQLKIAQLEVENAECFGGKYPAEIEWSRNHGVIVVSIIHKDKSPEFIYSSKAKHNLIENGDIFIVVGYQHDIEEFQKFIGGTKCQLV